MTDAPLDSLPGFRRRFRITPGAGWVRSELEDDYHCMSVTVHYEGGVATGIESVMERAPWTTCPGAVLQLEQSFTGVALSAFAARGEKSANCTHLHDLAVLASAHAGDDAPTVYDILVSDPVEGVRRAALRRDGVAVLSWVDSGRTIVEPPELAGTSLFAMRPWIDTLDPAGQEAAKLLRWGAIVAHGRTIPLADQSDASRMVAGSCFTFQPERMTVATRVGEIRDFSTGTAEPLGARA